MTSVGPVCVVSRLRLGVNEPKVEIRGRPGYLFFAGEQAFERNFAIPLFKGMRDVPGLTRIANGNGVGWILDLATFADHVPGACLPKVGRILGRRVKTEVIKVANLANARELASKIDKRKSKKRKSKK